jgi:hypothetical protein
MPETVERELALAGQTHPESPEPLRRAATHALAAWEATKKIEVCTNKDDAAKTSLMWRVATKLAEILAIYAG